MASVKARSYSTVKGQEKKSVILTSQELRKVIPGGRTVYGSLSLNLELGKKIGLVGVNGTGKSTLIKTLAGQDKDFEGTLVTANGLEIGYLPQEPELDNSKTVIQNIYDGISQKIKMLDRITELKSLSKESDSLEFAKEKNQLEKQIREQGLFTLKTEVKEVMEALACPPANSSVAHLSGGEKRRIALCRLLVSRPDLLLLDEPTNHIDTKTITWLQDYLTRFEGALILITHDKSFLNNVTDEILELDRGTCYFHKGKYNDWLESKDQRNEQNKQKIKEAEKFINLQNTKLSKVNNKARETQIEKVKKDLELIVDIKQTKAFAFPKVLLTGKSFLNVNNIARSIDGRLLFKGLSFKFVPGDIIGVIGPNGAGKTTLIKTLTEQEDPDEGGVELSKTCSVNYLEQTRMSLDPESTVMETIAGDDGRVCPSYLTMFNLKGSMQQQSLSTLSGGERNRVHLARMIKDPATFLFLDEPTNDLDKEVVANLEEAIKEFNGGIMIASHDIDFLSRICNRVISLNPSTNSAIYFRGTIAEFKKKHDWPTPKSTTVKMVKQIKKKVIPEIHNPGRITF